jgi:hypothetical protein
VNSVRFVISHGANKGVEYIYGKMDLGRIFRSNTEEAEKV